MKPFGLNSALFRSLAWIRPLHCRPRRLLSALFLQLSTSVELTLFYGSVFPSVITLKPEKKTRSFKSLQPFEYALMVWINPRTITKNQNQEIYRPLQGHRMWFHLKVSFKSPFQSLFPFQNVSKTVIHYVEENFSQKFHFQTGFFLQKITKVEPIKQKLKITVVK